MLPAPLFIHLTSSFLLSNLRLTIEPENLNSRLQIPIVLLSPNRNISLFLQNNLLLADDLPISKLFNFANKFLVNINCQHGLALQISVEKQNSKRVITSPSFCANYGMTGNFLINLLIGIFY